MDKEVLLSLARYNAYANQLVLQEAEKLSEEQLCFESQRSHSSVVKMLSHMRATGRGFLAMCRGKSMPREELASMEEIKTAFKETDQDLIEYIQSQTLEELHQEVDFHLGKFCLRLPAWKAMVQVFMHSTHHPGELSILMTELGLPLPTLDIIIQYADESGQPWPWK